MTFENMSQKLWPNMFFFLGWAVWANLKNHFVQKQKFEIGFLEFYICKKL